MRISITCKVVLVGALIALCTSCGVSSSQVEMAQASNEIMLFKDSAAKTLAQLLSDQDIRDELIAKVKNNPEGLSFTDSVQSYCRDNIQLGELSAWANEGALKSAVPQLWLFQPEGLPPKYKLQTLLVAYAPQGDESEWSEIRAYRTDGTIETLSPDTVPEESVLVIETNGRLAMQAGIQEANQKLKSWGLQPTLNASSTEGTWTVRLDSIRLQYDHEPWISGKAEMYAIASGVVGNNEPALRLVELPYLDHDKKTYYPNQILLDWADYEYQAANIQLFEHDDNTNYQDLVVIIVDAIGAIGSMAGYPQIQAITEIANRIIKAMPSHWYSNDDDYVDSFYTVEKNLAYSNYKGAAGNAEVTFTPFFLKKNQ